MAEYIDKQAAIDVFDEYWGTSLTRTTEAIKSIPAADVVEVVRCRDCKFSPLNNVTGCPIANLAYDGNRWCWRGEQDETD